MAGLVVTGLGCGSSDSAIAADTAPATAQPPRVVTSSDFSREVLLADRPVVVEFGAAWCQHCRDQTAVLGELADASTMVVTIDVDRAPDLAQRFAIDSLPTLVVVVAGQPIGEVRGVRDRAALAPLFTALASAQPTGGLDGVRSILSALSSASDGAGCSTGRPAGAGMLGATACELPAPCEHC